ncbi:SMI1/KNR4 family protein [Nocardioides sp. NPDC051685]|uniref:SMI1/KNR4 family protein n=1 Tax=Nocardioides sp. NPDC051685 TaxID=3364334 RepID=UPI0037BC4578
MTSLTYEETFPAAPASKLQELEERLGARLPQPYRDYLATQDGGALEGYNNHGIEIICGVGDVPKWSSLWHLLNTQSDVIPDGFIPVGSDAGGGLFLLAVAGADHGSVWHQSSETEVDAAGNVTPVSRERLADSWDEFLSSIEPLD